MHKSLAMYWKLNFLMKFNFIKLKTKKGFCVFAGFVLFVVVASPVSAKTINLGTSGNGDTINSYGNIAVYDSSQNRGLVYLNQTNTGTGYLGLKAGGWSAIYGERSRIVIRNYSWIQGKYTVRDSGQPIAENLQIR